MSCHILHCTQKNKSLLWLLSLNDSPINHHMLQSKTRRPIILYYLLPTHVQLRAPTMPANTNIVHSSTNRILQYIAPGVFEPVACSSAMTPYHTAKPPQPSKLHPTSIIIISPGLVRAGNERWDRPVLRQVATIVGCGSSTQGHSLGGSRPTGEPD